jgi:hypothetical protein
MITRSETSCVLLKIHVAARWDSAALPVAADKIKMG